MQRVLAHRVVFEGMTYKMAVVELSDDLRSIVIHPFAHETPSTTFVSGTVEVIKDYSGLYQLTTRHP